MIWVREVNSSMLNYVKTLMDSVEDHNGRSIDVKTFISKPNGELQIETYPSVTISLDSVKEASVFNDFNSYDISKVDEDTVLKKLKASKYSFSYTINFWAKSPLDLDAMTKKWMFNTPKYKVIDIRDVDTNTIYGCTMTQDGGLSVEGSTNATTGQATYRHIFVCHIIVGIDNNRSEEYTVVKSIKDTKEDV